MKNADNSTFPTVQTQDNQSNNGLTKREYFAGLAMQGLLANNHPFFWGNSEGECAEYEIAKEAVRHADELLKQLEK